MNQRVLFIIVALFVIRPATAQTPPADVQSAPQIVISATRVPQDGFNLPMAIDRIDAAVIGEGRLQVNLSEALNRVPGMVVQNRQNYAQDLQISSRGFGARSTFGVRGVRLIADGIPATMPDGQGQAATFNLSSAARIEVLRGPFASLYGNSSGGVVQIFTADGPLTPTVSSSFAAGSFDTKKYGLQFGGQHNDFNYLTDISRFETQGYRKHSATTRDQLNAKFKLSVGDGTLTLVTNALSQPDTQDPLGLTRAQVQAEPRAVDASALTFNTRKSVRQNQLGAVYDVGDSGNLAGALQAKIYGGNRTVKQYLGQEGNTPLSAGGIVDLDRRYSGIGMRWTRRASLADLALTLSVGIDRDQLIEQRRGFINNFGMQGALKRDEDDRVANTDFYAQAEWQLTDVLSISGGARRSRVKFDSTDYYIVAINPDDSGNVAYSRTTPVVGVLFKATPRWNIYANVGEGFETPTFAELAYRPNGATGFNFALQPASSRHVEFGIKGNIGSGASNVRDSTQLRAAVFRIDTKNEIVTNASSGGRSDFRNAATTRRDGIELSLERVLSFGFEYSLAYTWLNPRFRQAFSAGSPPTLIAAKNLLPGVAHSVLTAELIWRDRSSGFHAAIEYRATSKIYVNDANVDAAAGYGVANIRAGFQQQFSTARFGHWRLSEFIRVDNVTDHRYIGSVIVAEARGRYFEPAPGRNFMVGFNAAVSF